MFASDWLWRWVKTTHFARFVQGGQAGTEPGETLSMSDEIGVICFILSASVVPLD